MVNPITGKTNEQVLAESTAAAEKAASTIGGSFTQQGGYVAGPITGANLTPPTTNLADRVQTYTPPTVPNVAGLDTATGLATKTPAETQYQDLSTRLQAINDATVGRSVYQTTQEQTQGVPEIQKTQNDLRAKQQAILNEAAAIQLQGQRQDIPTAIGARQQSEALRNNAIDALGVSTLIAASQGNLANAQYLADKAVAAKYDPLEEESKAIIANLNLIKNSPDYTNAEKNRAQAQLDIQEKKKVDTARKKEDSATILSMAADVAKNGNATVANQLAAIASSDKPDLNAAFKLYSPFAQNPQDLQKSINELAIQRGTLAKQAADLAATTASDASVTPNVLQGMLNVYKSTGVLPAFGLSAKSPLRAQFYAALGAEGGSEIVSEANANKTIRAGLTTAYRTQQNQLSANQTAIGTLEKQLSLAQQYSDKISRAGSPFINKYLIAAKTGVFGDPDTAAFSNIVQTASYEFAKILSGAAASIAGVTVSSAADAQNMLNSSLTKGQFNEVLGLMTKEAQFRLKSQQDTLNQLQKDLSNIGALTTTLQNNVTKSGKPFDYQAAKSAGYTDAEIQNYLKTH